MEGLQNYWWFLISLLGALLVFLLFVQGGQTMLCSSKNEMARTLKVNCLGRKWELTFTTLVVFGGAFFASFPLFYSTSFGGAYWLWMLILFSFILQAISYEFRRKPGNIFGTRTYDTFLFINGSVGCILLGVAVGTLFFGADFTVTKGSIVDGSAPVISRWGDLHGLEAIADWRNLLLGFTLLFLARTNAALYFINNISEGENFRWRQQREMMVNGVIFVALFLILAVVILTTTGYRVDEAGQFVEVKNIFLQNLVQLWWLGLMLVIGVVLVLYAIYSTRFKGSNRGIWPAGLGTVLVILALLCALGYNHTAYMVSLTDVQSSLTIANSSSTKFTLTVMTWVSALLPVVVLYIAYVWRKLSTPAITPQEIDHDTHSY